MSFTYDVTTDVGKIRLLITDTDSADPIFSDQEIDAFQSLETTIRSTAALALETIARSEALTQKVIKTLQLSTDGAKLSQELRQHAAALRAQDMAVNDPDDVFFDVAEWVNGTFSANDILWRNAARGLLS